MSIIKLRYTDTADAIQTADFDPINDKTVPVTDKDNGATLRGTLYSHLLSARDKHTLTLSADELKDPAKENFIKDMFCRPSCEISFDDGATWRECTTDPGELSFEYVNGLKRLKQTTLTLNEVKQR